MKKILTMLIITSLLFTVNSAAKEKAESPSSIPLAMMSKLDMLSGDWLARTDMTNDDGETWQQGQAKRVTFTFKQRGLLLEELPIEVSENGFHMQTYISYDQYRQVFRKAAIDDVWGIMDLYQGQIVDNQLVLDNLAAQTFFPVGKNTWRGFKLTIELKPESRWVYIEKTDDNGKSWQPAFRVFYQKAP